MSGRPSSTQSFGVRAVDAVLVSLGFVRGDDGTLTAPTDSVVTLAPIGTFADGNTATAVLAKAALKISRAGAER